MMMMSCFWVPLREGGVHSNNNNDDALTGMNTTKMTTTTQICNNQPCGQIYFRQRGDGVVSTTMTMSKTTRISHDKDKDKENNQGGVDFKYDDENDDKDAMRTRTGKM